MKDSQRKAIQAKKKKGALPFFLSPNDSRYGDYGRDRSLREFDPNSSLSNFQWHKADSSDLLKLTTPEYTSSGQIVNGKYYTDMKGKKHYMGGGRIEHNYHGSERLGMADTLENRPTKKKGKN